MKSIPDIKKYNIPKQIWLVNPNNNNHSISYGDVPEQDVGIIFFFFFLP